jgi:hypothetical protein
MPRPKRAVAEPKKGKTKMPDKPTKAAKAKPKVSKLPPAKTETKAPPNPLLELVNGYVRYYREGWRVGTLVEVTKTHTRIRPIGGLGSKEKDCIKVAFEDIQRIDE